MRQIVNSGTPETRYQILQGHCVHIKQSPIKGNLHITKEHKSLGVLKTNFNFDVKRKVHLSITTFTSLEIKRIYSETEKNPEYE